MPKLQMAELLNWDVCSLNRDRLLYLAACLHGRISEMNGLLYEMQEDVAKTTHVEDRHRLIRESPAVSHFCQFLAKLDVFPTSETPLGQVLILPSSL